MVLERSAKLWVAKLNVNANSHAQILTLQFVALMEKRTKINVNYKKNNALNKGILRLLKMKLVVSKIIISLVYT